VPESFVDSTRVTLNAISGELEELKEPSAGQLKLELSEDSSKTESDALSGLRPVEDG